MSETEEFISEKEIQVEKNQNLRHNQQKHNYYT